MRPEWTREEKLRWLGGFIDGEGCFNFGLVATTQKSGGSFQPKIFISQHNKKVLEDIHAMFGFGYVVWDNYAPHIYFQGLERLKLFLIEVAPYLHLKRKAAEIMLAFINSRLQNLKTGPCPYTISEIALVRQLCEETGNTNNKAYRAAYNRLEGRTI